LEGLVRQLDEHPDVGVAGGLALFADGLLAHAGVAIDSNLTPVSLYRRLPAHFPGAHRRRWMAAVAGCLLVRREAFIAAGGFDESYKGNRVEIDFCFAVGRHGWRVAYTPETLFICLDMAAREDAADRLRFFAKWVGFLWPDQEVFWAQDNMNPIRLAALYEEALRGTAASAENLTSCRLD
jgi:GT2 family glycosyltransferase